MMYDRLLKLPSNLTREELRQVEDVVKSHSLGHLEETYMGMVIHVDSHVSDDMLAEHMAALSASLKKCMVCGNGVEYNGNAWRHISNLTWCPAADSDLPFPPPAFKGEGDAVAYTLPASVDTNEGLDALTGADKYRAIGEALRHGFGPDWMEKRYV